MLCPENKLLCMLQSHRVLSEDWAQRMFNVNKQEPSTVCYFPSGSIQTHIPSGRDSQEHTQEHRLISKITPFPDSPYHHHPLQITDHMSCHTVAVGGGVDKTAQHSDDLRCTQAENASTSWFLIAYLGISLSFFAEKCAKCEHMDKRTGR